MLVGQIVAVSHELERYLSKVVKLPAARICTVINGIKTGCFAPRPRPSHLMDEFKLPSSCQVVGTVGRLDGVKDQESMIEAFALVVKVVPEARLFLVGDGPMRDELQELIASHSLDEKVVITGTRDDIPEILNLFDLFVLTSVSEGTSISLLEAMASGLPSVVTNVGGNPSIIDHGINGLLVEPKEIKNIADAIVSLLRDSSRREQFGQRAMAKVRANYSLEKMIADYEEIYFRLLRKKRKYKHLID